MIDPSRMTVEDYYNDDPRLMPIIGKLVHSKEWEAVHGKFSRKKFTYYTIVFVDGEFAAMHGRIVRDKPNDKGYAGNLWVEPKFRGNGIATMLLKKNRTFGVRAMTKNPIAMHINEKLGFEKVGHFMGYTIYKNTKRGGDGEDG